MTTVNEKLQAARERLNAANQAERDRLAQERKHQQDIEAAQREIHALETAQMKESLKSARQQAAQVAQENEQAVSAMFDALNECAAQVRALLPSPALATAVDSTWQKQRAARQQVGALEMTIARRNAQSDGDNWQSWADASASRNQLPAAMDKHHALRLWVSQAPDDVERNIRAGILRALTGNDYDYAPGVDWKAIANNHMQAMERQG